MSAPIVLPLLMQVAARAGGRCECTQVGCHGQQPRCPREAPATPLIAVPKDPTVLPSAATRLPASALRASCRRCATFTARAVRRAAVERTTPLLEVTP